MQAHNTQRIDPKRLLFSPWNVNSVSAENQTKLEESIKRNGIFRPIIVRELDDGSLQVIGGEHTTRAAIALGYEEIDVYNLGQIGDKRAKEISIIDNQQYGHEDTFELANLLKELDGDIESFLPMSDEDLKSIFKATTIDFDSLEIPDSLDDEDEKPHDTADDLALAPITSQILRFKVPLADAEFVQRSIETVIKRQGFSSPDSLASAGDALVYILNNWNK